MHFASKTILLLSFMVCCGCAKNAHHEGAATAPASKLPPGNDTAAYWQNPVIDHRLSQRETPFRSFPFEANQTDAERKDEAGFEGFIQAMNASFAESNLAIDEADLLYAIVQKSALLNTDPAATNQRDARPPSALPMDKVKQRVAFSKLKDGQGTAIFYKHYDCGWKYSYRHLQINPRDSSITHVEEMETWVARTPC